MEEKKEETKKEENELVDLVNEIVFNMQGLKEALDKVLEELKKEKGEEAEEVEDEEDLFSF